MDSERYVSFSVSDLYPEWQEQAHCRGVGHDYYFGEEDELPPFIAQIRRASKLCDVCPVFRECLTHALTYREDYGVWAGTTQRGRRKMFARIDKGEEIKDLVEEVCSERKGEAEVEEITGSGRSSGRGDSANPGRRGVPEEARRMVSR